MQQKFQSISGHQFEQTHSLVRKVIEMQNQKEGDGSLTSRQSSEITIKYDDGSGGSSLKKRKTSLDDRHLSININDINEKMNNGEDRRSMFNSIDIQAINSIKPQMTPRFDHM